MPAVRAWLVAAGLGAVVLMLPRSADDGSWGWLLDGGLVVRRAPPRPAWPAAPRSLAHPERWNVHRDFPRRCGMAAPPLPEATRRFVDELWRLMPDIIPRGFASAHAVWEEHVCMYDCLDRLRRELERLRITRWTATSGTLFGVRCAGSILPYDKDVDLVMGCADMHALYESAAPAPGGEGGYFPGTNARKLGADGLFIEMTDGGWFARIRMVHTTFEALRARVASGPSENDIDIFCWGPQQRTLRATLAKGAAADLAMGALDAFDAALFETPYLDQIAPAALAMQSQCGRVSGAYLARGGELRDVAFGPTTVRVVPPAVADGAVNLEYNLRGAEEAFMCVADGDAARVAQMVEGYEYRRRWGAPVLTVTPPIGVLIGVDPHGFAQTAAKYWGWRRAAQTLRWLGARALRRAAASVVPALAIALVAALAVALSKRACSSASTRRAQYTAVVALPPMSALEEVDLASALDDDVGAESAA